MSERMETLRAMLNEEKHHAWRKPLTEEKWAEISAQIQDPALSLDARAALRLKLFLENESRFGEFIDRTTFIDDILIIGEQKR